MNLCIALRDLLSCGNASVRAKALNATVTNWADMCADFVHAGKLKGFVGADPIILPTEATLSQLPVVLRPRMIPTKPPL